jgi:hypothetical protein
MTELKVLAENCFGNFNDQLNSCRFCEVAVECYEASKKGEVSPQGRTGDERGTNHSRLPID